MWQQFFLLGPMFLLTPLVLGQLEDADYGDEVPSTHIPHILSTPTTLNVLEGETVSFPCDIDDIGVFVRLWKKGKTQVLFAGNVALVRDRRFSIVNETMLQIKSIRASDAGEYICQISTYTPLELSHTLHVLVPPEIHTIPADGDVIVKVGESALFGCKATGYPKPTITWEALEGRLPTKNKAELKEEISIPVVDKTHSGVFECTASNNLGDSKSATIRVKVLYPPELESPASWIHAGIDTTVELSCTIHAEPHTSVTWTYDDGTLIHANEHIRLKSHENTYTLQIRKVMFDDFTTYLCKANNSLGASYKAIEVSGLASPVIFKSNPNGKQQSSFQLMWTVKSYSPVNEYILKIREQKNNDTEGTEAPWLQVVIPSGGNQHSLIQSQTYNITGLKYATTYEAVIQAQNDFGFNQPSDVYVFSTEGKVVFTPTVPDVFQVLSTDDEDMLPTVDLMPSPEEVEENSDKGNTGVSLPSRGFQHWLILISLTILLPLFLS